MVRLQPKAPMDLWEVEIPVLHEQSEGGCLDRVVRKLGTYVLYLLLSASFYHRGMRVKNKLCRRIQCNAPEHEMKDLADFHFFMEHLQITQASPIEERSSMFPTWLKHQLWIESWTLIKCGGRISH